jgi:hypothetical protein
VKGFATYEWIAHVQVGSIDRISGSDGGYAGPRCKPRSPTELVIGDTFADHVETWDIAGPHLPGILFRLLGLGLGTGSFTTDEVVFHRRLHPSRTRYRHAHRTGIGPGRFPHGLRVAMKYGSALPNGLHRVFFR